MSALDHLRHPCAQEQERIRAQLRDERLVSDECQCPVCRSDCAGIVPCEQEDRANG